MIIFNFDLRDDIEVETREESVLVHIGEDTLGYNPTTDGISITPDWTDNRFTIAFEQDSLFYHLTDEDVGEKRAQGRHISHEAFIADMYCALRSISALRPISELSTDTVYKFELNKAKYYLTAEGVIEHTGKGLRVNSDRKREFEKELNESSNPLVELAEHTLRPISVDEAFNSGEWVFVIPTKTRLLVVFLFPDGYYGSVPLDGLIEIVDSVGRARVADVMAQALEGLPE